jgi:hypothetical protein
MTVATAAPERFDIGRVFSSGFDIVRRQPVTLIIITVLFGFIPTAATLWLTDHFAPTPAVGAPPNIPAALGRVGLIELVAIFVAGFAWILPGTFATAVMSDLAGRPISAAQALARSAPRWPIAYGLGVLAAVAILLGTLFFIVPGILLSLAWCMGGIVATVEKTGFKSFGRSAELTRDNRLNLFIIFLVYGIAGVVLGLVVRLIGGGLAATGGGPLWLTLGLSPLVSAAVQLFLNATVVAAYVELRGVKEGLAATSLAATFD